MLQLTRRPILWLAALILVALLAFSVAPIRANTSLLRQLDLSQRGVPQETADIEDFLSLPSYQPTSFGTEDCRIGVISGLDNGSTVKTNQWIETLDASWYVNFAPYPSTYRNTSGTPVAVDSRHMPVIHIRQDKNSVTGVRLDSYTMQLSGDQTLTKQELTRYIQLNIGGLWAIGNEPDREGAQDDTMPELYARAYHEIREFVLSVDSTAQFANAGLVQVTPSRIQYLDTVMSTYQARYGKQMPVDVWNIHVYPLEELTNDGNISNIASIALGSPPSVGQRAPTNNSECNSGDPESPNYNNNPAFVTDDVTCFAEHDDVRVFQHQIETMRQWMKSNGEQDKPLIISEMGVLWPYIDNDNVDGDPETCEFLQDEFGRCLSPRRVSRFMSDVNDYLINASSPSLGYSKGSNHNLVQQWAWFSVYQPDLGTSSNLIYDPSGYLVPGQQSALTEIGQTFQSYAQTPASELVPNLYIDGTPDGFVTGRTADGLNRVEFRIPLRNDGNTSTDAETSVMIYTDPSMEERYLAGRAVAPAGIGGCATDVEYATVTSHVFPDATRFYVKIRDGQDENDAVAEDNVYANGSGNPIATTIRRQQGVVFLPFMNTK